MHTNRPTCIRIPSACPKHWQWKLIFRLIRYAQTTEKTCHDPWVEGGYAVIEPALIHTLCFSVKPQPLCLQVKLYKA